MRHTSHRRLLLILGAGLAVLVVAVIASAFAVIVAALQQAVDAGALHVDDPETTTRLLLGALTRGAMLIASSSDPVQTRDAVSRSMRALLNGLRPSD